MQKSFRTTAILASVLLVLSLWYWVYEKGLKSKAAQNEEKGKQLVSLAEPEIAELSFTRIINAPEEGSLPAGTEPKFEAFKLQKIDSHWRILTPKAEQADDSVVSGMISTLVATKQERVVDEKPTDKKPYGLDPAVLNIVVAKVNGEKPETVSVGVNTPVGFSSYATTGEGKTVWRVARSLRSSFEKDFFALRDKAVVTLTKPELSEVEIKGKAGSRLVKREGAGDDWVFAREGTPLDSNEWGKLLAVVLDARALSFPESVKNLSTFGLAQPRATVTFTKTADKSTVTVLYGKGTVPGKEKYFAKRADKDTIYEVDKQSLEALEKPFAALENRTLSKFNRYQVSKVRLERAGEPVELRKDDKGVWSFAEAQPGVKAPTDKANNTKVDSLLTHLQDTKVEKFLPGEKKLADGAAKLVIRVFEKKDGVETEKVQLRFSPAGGTVRGDRADLAPPFVIAQARYQLLDLRAKDFIGEPPKPPDAGAVVPPAGAPKKNDAAKESDHEGHDHGPGESHG